ncbi:MAG: alpha-glucan family phosphorylase [candidate division KSB1 bacterium]|nr:alpha-glucan family phosphorylase [candidate division KSB1 bacterium]
MRKIQKFTVLPNLPGRLKHLLDIAYNLWWSWNPEARSLFRRIDNDLWEEIHHNPVRLLGTIKPERYQELLTDDVFLEHADRVYSNLQKYLQHLTWYGKLHQEHIGGRIAYFSAEFGLHECLPFYSGGLGVLAGDHLKSASELGLPMVGVGLLYQYGYFRQYLNRDGWQQEIYSENDFYNMPLSLERQPDGSPVTIAVEYPQGPVSAQILRVQVGRVPLYLLDSNIEKNSPEDRKITAQLYGGDREMRIRQEILLGIGGIRALEALGLSPTVCHINEGHSAFLALERIRIFMEKEKLTFAEAKEVVTATNVFTTHTPVPAGIDTFSPELMKTYFSEYSKKLGLSFDDFLALGRQNPKDPKEPFCMAVLALNLAAYSNGVSKLHGQISRQMWHNLWPSLPENEVPITHISNGVHTCSWLSDEIARLYDRYLGPKWLEDPVDQKLWERVDHIPDSELWRSHERLRERLVSFARKRLGEQLKQRGAHRLRILEADEILDPEVLTIGFARRFATYKRSTLLLMDKERLARILNNPEGPVQVIFAGKAHPNDQSGKELIREIIHIASQKEFRRRLVFLEDYDIETARYLVQGVDVWLNTPRRPLEASGTSGMKVAINGGINLSVLDGWWCEAYRGDNGWAIGNGELYDDLVYQDEVESQALYELLEKEIVPLFYHRGADGLPRDWIAMMKTSMRTICPVFNTNRMVEEYTERFYLPCLLQWNLLSANNLAEAKKLVQWKSFMTQHWDKMTIVDVEAENSRQLQVGESLPLKARIRLGSIPAENVVVEIIHGPIDLAGQIVEGEAVRMNYQATDGDGIHIFTGSIPCTRSGHCGFTVRILPCCKKGFASKFDMRLLKWW